MNILITSVGRRTQLLKYFKNELKGKGNLVATDLSKLAPALYVADRYYLVPSIKDADYIDVVLDICSREHITGILSLIDPELSLLSKNSARFNEIGVQTIVSPYDVCEMFLDKYQTYMFCIENGFRTAATYINYEEFEESLAKQKINFPVFLKPRRGSASIQVKRVDTPEEAKLLFQLYPDMIIQEYLQGRELGVDVYVDCLTKKVISVFTKEKLAMRAGETDKSKSIKSDKLCHVIERFVTSAGLVGPIDIDVFNINDEYYISEVNPRFGGGYVHAYECGVNFPQFIINNLGGITNTPQLNNYEENTYLMKHDTVTLLRL